MKRFMICATILALLCVPMYAQTVSDQVTNISDKNKGYLQPLVDAFGADLNSGLYHTARVHDFLGIDVGVRVMFALIPSDKLTFMGYPPSGSPVQTATVFGGVGTAIQAGNPFQFPDGVDQRTLSIAVPQASVGLIMGTEALVRYVPPVRFNANVGEVSFYGIGLKHSLSQYFPVLPLDVALHGSYQHLLLKNKQGGSLVTADAYVYGLIASKKFEFFTLYGGVGAESSKMTLDYTYSYQLPNLALHYDLEGQNKMRYAIGASVKIVIFDVSIDYTLADQPVLTLGASLTVR
ncbi:MAG: hypothetical protein COS95_07015 [Ignavibacteriales bacterium CG07_land_8_20_14_0_80_59_12]|nr:MAG: hypothetical protein COS95_07015 [Ignavibacteriales bacterium CG07_land_8_20_14_0_80_59_12]